MTKSGHSVHRDLAWALKQQATRTAKATPAVRGADWRMATVTEVPGDGTVVADGIPCRCLETYNAPLVGDLIIITQSSAGNWLALGRTATAEAALGRGSYAYKPANQDRASTTTMLTDPDLTLPLSANAVYVVEFHLFVGGPAGGLMVTQWSVPAGADGLKGVHGPASSVTETTAGNTTADGVLMRAGSHGHTTLITYGRRNSNTNLVYAIETGTVMTTSAGACALQWAPSGSSATATRMGRGSWMRATRIA
ncbi:hypothetical protein [Streptomyces sp. MJP52]|uniref:hypothetical protein n=1 Tax=Streptomyces sp. MJP52 TaxID=2940555 RepID=UPI00247529E7|nr:hypothetical protein [Streptomyces sp. MJP52]MDH6224368.1 hypothetical protein [Streptomyces sp. MJP52]